MDFKTLDYRVYHALDGLGPITWLYQALVGLWTNSDEPMPTGGQRNRWPNDPPWKRYLKWHIRNWAYDFKNYTIGVFGRDTTFHVREHWLGPWQIRLTAHQLTDTRWFRWVFLPRIRIVYRGDQHPMIYVGWMRNGRFGLAAKAVFTAGPWYSRAIWIAAAAGVIAALAYPWVKPLI